VPNRFVSAIVKHPVVGWHQRLPRKEAACSFSVVYSIDPVRSCVVVAPFSLKVLHLIHQALVTMKMKTVIFVTSNNVFSFRSCVVFNTKVQNLLCLKRYSVKFCVIVPIPAPRSFVSEQRANDLGQGCTTCPLLPAALSSNYCYCLFVRMTTSRPAADGTRLLGL